MVFENKFEVASFLRVMKMGWFDFRSMGFWGIKGSFLQVPLKIRAVKLKLLKKIYDTPCNDWN